MTRAIRISPELSLPLDSVTQTFLVVGKRGSGKSNTAARLVEQLHHAGIPFVVLDPVDTWWGLKAGRDGGTGLAVYVFGGRKADLPLNPDKGAELAEVLCEHRISMVLSVKHLSGRERSTFMVAFAQTLFQKWNGGPLHVVLEEAHELAPQSAQNGREGEQQMLGAFKRLWKLGRSSGIGGTAVTQRPASLSKDITTQSEVLIAHRTIGPQDVKAVGEWVKYHGQHESILGELPRLPTGQAFIWAPEFPSDKPIGLQRITVSLRETYDSASTPKVGEERREPKELTPVDLKRLEKKMAATIEKAKAEDPKELRKRIAELERANKAKQGPETRKSVEAKVIEKPVLKDGQLERAEKFMERLSAEINRARRVPDWINGDFINRIQELSSTINLVRSARSYPEANRTSGRADLTYLAEKKTREVARRLSSPLHPKGDSDRSALTGARLKIVRALAELEVIGVAQPTRAQLGFYVGMTFSGGYGSNTLGTMRTEELIEYPGDGRIALTDIGHAAAGEVDPPASLDELHARVRNHLTGLEVRVFDALVALGQGNSVTREQLGELTQATYSGGYGSNVLGALHTAGIIQYPTKGSVGPSDLLFPESLS